MIIYPLNILPYPSVNISGSSNPVLATTQFEVATRQREVYTHTEQDISVQLLLDDFKFEFFKSWVKSVLKSGSMSFQFPLPGVDGPVASQVKIVNGIINWASESNFWKVSFVVRQEQPALVDLEMIQFLASLEDGNERDFASMAEILYLQLNSFYGQSSLSPEISNFINSQN